MDKKVTVVCYTFPPMPGVGGRKWAKYCNFLRKRDWDITVISAKSKPGDFSPWTADTEGIHRIELDSNYPEVLSSTPNSIGEKLRYRWHLYWVKKRTKSNYYDRAVFWESLFEREVGKVLQAQKSEILVVSGGPFSLLYYGAKMKAQNVKLRYIADIRDAWVQDAYFGFGSLDNARKLEERRRLKYVLQMADVVLVPNAEIQAMCLREENTVSDKIAIVPHAVDARWILPKAEAKTETRGILYFGSVFSGLDTVIETLCRQMVHSNGKLTLDIYSSDRKYLGIFEKYRLLGNGVQYHEPVDQQVVFERLAQSAAAIILVPESFRDFIVTKFMEIVASRTPILAMGYPGEVSRMIEEHRLGIFLNAADPGSFENLYEQLGNLNYNSNFDFSDYTFEKQVNTLEKLFLNEA